MIENTLNTMIELHRLGCGSGALGFTHVRSYHGLFLMFAMACPLAPSSMEQGVSYLHLDYAQARRNNMNHNRQCMRYAHPTCSRLVALCANASARPLDFNHVKYSCHCRTVSNSNALLARQRFDKICWRSQAIVWEEASLSLKSCAC